MSRRKWKEIVIVIVLFCVATLQFGTNHYIKASDEELWTYRNLSEQQNRIIHTIYRICSENWDKYGVLPSTCMAQAMKESTLGENLCGQNNLWGIKSSSSATGWANYDTLEDGILGYCETICNGRYEDARYCRYSVDSLNYIVQGGYCPDEGYLESTLQILAIYGFDDFDTIMFDQQEDRRKNKKRQKEKIRKKQEKLQREQERLLEEQRKEAEERRRQQTIQQLQMEQAKLDIIFSELWTDWTQQLFDHKSNLSNEENRTMLLTQYLNCFSKTLELQQEIDSGKQTQQNNQVNFQGE